MLKINNKLEKLITEGCIEYYEYSDFKNIQPIGKGSFGSVSRATWKNTIRFFALKSFNNDKQTHKEIIKELTLHKKVDIHENILRFYGITSLVNVHQMKEYFLVLEYADSDTLNTYLNNYFNELNWSDKLRLAFQLASAVECIHCCDIIHRDLHAKNILIHQKNIKLADFGLSKKIAEESSNAKNVFGVIPYIDPKSLNDQQYRLNKKSDIYSIGVLMWQISSGRQPFKDKGLDYDMKLSVAILNGFREEIINETPVEYSNLYKECWKYEPDNRPDIQKVVLTLNNILSSERNDTIKKSSSGKNEENSLRVETYQPGSKSIDRSNAIISDINQDLFIDSSIKANLSNDKSNSITKELNYIQPNMVESKSSLSSALIEVMDSSSRNLIELELEKDGFTTPDEKARELIKKLTETKYLHALKLLFENLKNEFSPQILRDVLVALADPTPFDYYAKQSVTRLELHLRTWMEVLERICFSPMYLSKELQDKIYNSLTKFAEIYHKTTQIMEGLDNNNFNPYFDQQKNGGCEKIAKNRNYNVEFLLIHLRDTLNSLRDNETWFQEIIRKAKELLEVLLNIVPGILSATSGNTTLNDNYSIISILTQLRQDLTIKYPVAPYYIDWRIMLIIQYNILNWSDSSEKIINKKFGEMLLMEYIWGFLEREWHNVANESILYSQIKFDELSNKLVKSLKNTGGFLSKPFTLPHILWFGMLDLAQNLILKSAHTTIHGLGYYLAIESLNKAPSSFIQFKAIEILWHLYNLNNRLFSMVEVDFDQYAQKLKENNLATDHFQNLLVFVKEIYLEDLNILNDGCEFNSNNKGKGKGKEKGKDLDQNILERDQISNPSILDVIAIEMICPISSEPTDHLCILKCQHVLSLNNFKRLKRKNCPECREKIEDNDIRYVSQNTIYKNLYPQLFEAGYILPSIELEDSNNQYDNNSDSENSEAEFILAKKKKFIKTLRLKSNVSLRSIFPRISKKKHPIYQSAMKELSEKNYDNAISYCKKFLKSFPSNYAVKCVLAYIYRCINNYEQAHLYLEEAINLKERKPIAYFIRGEIFFWQSEYEKAINNLRKSLDCKAKINNLYIILGNSNLFGADAYNYDKNYLSVALKNYIVALHDNPNNYLCLKNSAYIYERQKNYSVALKTLDRLLNINKEDSIILCYCGEILSNMEKYREAISYFTKANIIDPENVHNLNKRAVTYLTIQEYDKSLSDLNKVIQLKPLNSIAYYNKILIYMILLNYNIYSKKLSTNYYYIVETMENVTDTLACFEKCIELDLRFWSQLCKINKINDYCFEDLGIINKFNKFMYKVHKIYFITNLINLDSKYHRFKENSSNSLTGYVLSFKNETFNLSLPTVSVSFENAERYWIIWKINIKDCLSKSCFLKFLIKGFNIVNNEYKFEFFLKFEELIKFKGLGWIEYKFPYNTYYNYLVEPSIEINGPIDMQIDYVRFIPFNQTKINHILANHEIYLNVPEAFKDKYFSRKEMENLLELKDIIR
ncbi:hypothetical protein RclHR1_09990004 [Rhizophagus clarus]|uniref:Protein kinase domain-containing protein n=1 Tax=Rhizophagus clarus TaxID=94130 RepID=A0A2Z6SRJ1_9GLOM|nr:hypothetical protein RclHR1_09990004 [Rhizophagus clarus]GES87240.1 hypothetical protein GLOIN_2v1869755 [Rhizophagus clarus]